MLKNKAFKFALTFIVLFLVFYYFNIGFFSVTSPGTKHYNPYLNQHSNYIAWLRNILLGSTSVLLNLIGFTAITNDYQLLVAGHGTIKLVYSCLGLGVMSFFAAFVIAYPKPLRQKIYFLAAGLIAIQILNILRLAIVALYWTRKAQLIIDHHLIFNSIIYLLISVALYFWVTAHDKKPNAKNQAINI